MTPHHIKCPSVTPTGRDSRVLRMPLSTPKLARIPSFGIGSAVAGGGLF